MTKPSPWERIPHSVRFVPAEAKGHLAYFTSRYRRAYERGGTVGIEERQGRPVYVKDLFLKASTPGKAAAACMASLASEVIEPLLKALEDAESAFGGPPND